MKHVLNIGLVNNMPDAALEATERQFVTLLNEAVGDETTLRLVFYTLPMVPRGELGRGYLNGYREIGELWGSSLDGIIVTGTEPRASKLEDEPYWADMVRLVDWAMQNTTSAIWSCLAAHAAVLLLDGIPRHRRSEKRFGIFKCGVVSEHFLNAGAPEEAEVPHSRWNDLCADELKAAGYEILTRIGDAGVDAFVKQDKSLFVFLQGHPEYDADTLLREYHRDVKRFLRGDSQVCPSLPNGYADSLSAIPNTWRANSVRLYRNWLSYLGEQKGEALQRAAMRAQTAKMNAKRRLVKRMDFVG